MESSKPPLSPEEQRKVNMRLIQAAFTADLEKAQQAIADGADVNVDHRGITPLQGVLIVSFMGAGGDTPEFPFEKKPEDHLLKMVGLFMAHGAHTNTPCSYEIEETDEKGNVVVVTHHTSLHLACQTGNIKVVRLLMLDPALNVEAQDSKRRLPTHYTTNPYIVDPLNRRAKQARAAQIVEQTAGVPSSTPQEAIAVAVERFLKEHEQYKAMNTGGYSREYV